jgi:uncharacterized damage-inducible protein DinB
MTAILEDAFRHHTWATLRVLDTCRGLSEQQLTSSVDGIYGTILDTLRHLVGADAWYLYVLTDGRVDRIDEDTLDLDELQAVASRHPDPWDDVLRARGDPDEDIVVRRDDGSEGHATAGIRLAQVIHHGTDHRSQICTALTALGHEPPEIDVWAYGEAVGRSFDRAAPA